MTDQTFLSLGAHCYTAWLIQNCKLKTARLPFDWLFSDPGMVADCIEDDFSSFIRPDLLIPLGEHGGVMHHGHAIYSNRWNRPTIFLHHDPSTAEGRSYFAAAVEKMRSVMQDRSPKVFILLAAPERATAAKIDRLSGIIQGRADRAMILVIVLQRKNVDLLAPSVNLIRQSDVCMQYDFTPTSDMRFGTSFEKKHDDDAVAVMVEKAAACMNG